MKEKEKRNERLCVFFLPVVFELLRGGGVWLDHIWVLIALLAALLGALLTALFNLNNKVDALKKQVEELTAKLAVPPVPPEEKAEL